MSKKRIKRIAETNEFYETAKIEASAVDVIQSKDDSALFMVDRTGSKAGRKKVATEIIPKKEKTFISPTEKILINKLVQEQKSNKKRKMYGDEIVMEKTKKIEVHLQDLWDVGSSEQVKPKENNQAASNIANSNKKRKIEPTKKALKVALPGQSYHPTVEDHQNVIAEAVAIEIKRQDALAENALIRPSNILNNTEITQMFLSGENFVPDDDEDEEDDDDENALENFTEDGKVVQRKRVNKNNRLTTAQKNKRRTMKLAQQELEKTKKQGLILNTIDQIKTYQAELQAKEEKSKVKKEIREQLLAAKKQLEDNSLTNQDVSTIPLSDELNGSLRTLIPKGIAVVDRTNSMLKAEKLTKKSRQLRKHGENPHGAKRIKWYPKYKLPQK